MSIADTIRAAVVGLSLGAGAAGSYLLVVGIDGVVTVQATAPTGTPLVSRDATNVTDLFPEADGRQLFCRQLLVDGAQRLYCEVEGTSIGRVVRYAATQAGKDGATVESQLLTAELDTKTVRVSGSGVLVAPR